MELPSVYVNGEETRDRVEAHPETGLIRVTGRSGAVEARVTKDDTTHPVDIIEDILTEVGLQEAIAPEDFPLAKGLTPEYAIGACFENIPAAQALREILKRCLLDLWVDFGEIASRPIWGMRTDAWAGSVGPGPRNLTGPSTIWGAVPWECVPGAAGRCHRPGSGGEPGGYRGSRSGRRLGLLRPGSLRRRHRLSQ